MTEEESRYVQTAHKTELLSSPFGAGSYAATKKQSKERFHTLNATDGALREDNSRQFASLALQQKI